MIIDSLLELLNNEDVVALPSEGSTLIDKGDRRCCQELYLVVSRDSASGDPESIYASIMVTARVPMIMSVR